MPLPGYESGTVAGDRFVIREEIGEGGAACVFRAHDLSTAATVALKVAKSPDEDTTANLYREANALRTVHHPHVAACVACGSLGDGRAFLAMQYARGCALRTMLLNGPLVEHDALLLGGVVAGALGAIHGAGMIHRDLKPDNIIVPCDDDVPAPGRAMLVDLGVFGAIHTHHGPSGDTPRTSWGRVSGTALYMAPEQLAGRAQTTATDSYALGLLLHECLYGVVPLANEEVQSWHDPATGAFLAFTGPLVRRRLVERVTLPAAPEIDPALRALMLALLDPDPRRRPARMADVARSLRDLRMRL